MPSKRTRYNQPTTYIRATVVKQLTNHFHDLGYHLYLDNYYTKVQRLSYLFGNGIYACGTCCGDPFWFPAGYYSEVQAYIPTWFHWWRMCDKVLNAFWMDNKPVNYLSTMHPPECDNDTPENLCVVKQERKKVNLL